MIEKNGMQVKIICSFLIFMSLVIFHRHIFFFLYSQDAFLSRRMYRFLIKVLLILITNAHRGQATITKNSTILLYFFMLNN